jgi:hypothetical protein
MKFISVCDATGIIECELFADVYRRFGRETVRNPVVEIVGKVMPFANGNGHTLQVRPYAEITRGGRWPLCAPARKPFVPRPRPEERRSRSEGFRERVGVCRDFTHLAITLCRCMNIPARYATGYLGDIGVPSDPNPMDFSAWFEAYLGGHWHTFDARHNRRRIGRVLIGRGHDASDVPITMAFGKHLLENFRVTTEEIRAGNANTADVR